MKELSQQEEAQQHERFDRTREILDRCPLTRVFVWDSPILEGWPEKLSAGMTQIGERIKEDLGGARLGDTVRIALETVRPFDAFWGTLDAQMSCAGLLMTIGYEIGDLQDVSFLLPQIVSRIESVRWHSNTRDIVETATLGLLNAGVYLRNVHSANLGLELFGHKG